MRRYIDRLGYWEKIFGLILGLGGVIYAGVTQCNKWNETTDTQSRIVPIVYRNQSDIQIQKVTEANHYDEIMKHLIRIENKIDR